jgi:thymidine phosphorylase
MDKWRDVIRAQGGDPDAALPVARETHTVLADRDGVLVEQQALPFGIGAWRLGAGRARKQDPVQHAAGIDLHAKPGDTIRKGQPLFTLSADEPERFARALEAVDGAWRIGDPGEPVLDGGPLIAERIGR